MSINYSDIYFATFLEKVAQKSRASEKFRMQRQNLRTKFQTRLRYRSGSNNEILLP
jgi:hypothetical protein